MWSEHAVVGRRTNAHVHTCGLHLGNAFAIMDLKASLVTFDAHSDISARDDMSPRLTPNPTRLTPAPPGWARASNSRRHKPDLSPQGQSFSDPRLELKGPKTGSSNRIPITHGTIKRSLPELSWSNPFRATPRNGQPAILPGIVLCLVLDNEVLPFIAKRRETRRDAVELHDLRCLDPSGEELQNGAGWQIGGRPRSQDGKQPLSALDDYVQFNRHKTQLCSLRRLCSLGQLVAKQAHCNKGVRKLHHP